MKNVPLVSAQIKSRVIKARKDNQQVRESSASGWKQHETPDYKKAEHRSGTGRALGLRTQPNFCSGYH